MCVYETNNKLQKIIINGKRKKEHELFVFIRRNYHCFTGNVKSYVTNVNKIINNIINNNSAHEHVSAFK